jgi:hypothetical protein
MVRKGVLAHSASCPFPEYRFDTALLQQCCRLGQRKPQADITAQLITEDFAH